MPSNAQVLESSVSLIFEFLLEKGFEDSASLLKKEMETYFMEDPDGDYFPNAADVCKLERIFATTILQECEVNTAKQAREATQKGKKSASAPFQLAAIREIENEWEEEDIGYEFIPTPESELHANAASEYQAMTVPHNSYEVYPIIDEETEEIVKRKISQLKQFPDELEEFVVETGFCTRNEYSLLNEQEIEETLFKIFSGSQEHFEPEEDVFNGGEEYESFYLKVVQVKQKTGFQEAKDFQIIVGDLIAGRYQVQEYLGSAAFSTAIQCFDFVSNTTVCLKIITNNKDFFDQSLDEIKLLTLLKNTSGDDLDRYNLLQIHDYFYFKEHLFLVTELLRDNLFEFSQYNIQSGDELYFTLDRLKSITKQILVAVNYLHDLDIIHCDLKPENILIKSYSRSLIKVIDVGSSCFTTDHLSSYVQSRSYRAPEVILGLPYGKKIDIWSVGCIVAELLTGQVLFLNDTLATLLARVEGIIGPVPQYMKNNGAYTSRFYTDDGVLYDRRSGGPSLISTRATSLKHLLDTDDSLFLDLMTKMLQIDPTARPTAAEALNHPWFST